MRFIWIICLAGVLSACADGATGNKASPETVCAAQGFSIGTPEFAACVKRERGYRRMEDFRKESDQREFYRDFERSRRF